MKQGCYTSTFVIGIDPGVPVTMAMLNPKGEWVAHAKPRPAGATPQNNVWMFTNILKKWKAAAGDSEVVAVIEWVSPRPREGVVSVGKFMGSFWMAKAACAALDIPFTLISPRRWKPRMKLDEDKANSIKLAKSLFKTDRAEWRLKRKQDHDFAEAALLAYYLMNFEPKPALPAGGSVTGPLR